MFSGLVSIATSMPLWAVVLLAAVLVILLFSVVMVLIRANRRPGEEKPKRKPKRKTEEDRDPTGMVRACRQFHSRVAQAFPGARARYRLPLFAVVGPSQEANASLVRGAGLSQPLGDSVSSGGLTWTAFDRAATVEVHPDILLDSTSGRDRWRTFWRLLQRFRPQRPLDGVILVLPAGTLNGENSDSEDQQREAETIRECLAELENRLCMTLPIHCVIAEGEAIEGFEQLGHLLAPYQLERPLGYASPYSSKEVYRPEIVDQAVQHIGRRAQMLVLEALTVEQATVEADSLFTLPAGIERLRAGLRKYLDTVLEPGQYARLTALRGIFVIGQADGLPAVSDRHVAFAEGALNERIFPEFSLAEPTGGRWVAANRDVRRAQVAAGVLFGLAAVGLYTQDRILANRVPQVESLVATVAKDYRRTAIARSEGGGSSNLFGDGSIEVIQRMSSLEGDYLRSIFVPSSWFGQLPRDLDRLQTGAYIETLFKSLGKSLSARAQELVSETGGTRGRSRSGASEESYPDYARMRDQLKRYSRLVTQIEHYQRLQKGNRDAFALRALSSYLYDMELPDGFFPDLDLDALGARDLVLKPIKAADFAEQARSTFLEIFGQFTFDLTTRDRIPARLRTVQDILSERQRLFQSQEGSLGRLRQLYAHLQHLEDLFAQNRYKWVVQKDRLIEADFEALLGRVAENRFLGRRVAGRMRQNIVRTRRQFKNELTGIQVRDFGAIVATTEQGLQLTPEARRVLERLRGFGLTSDSAGSDFSGSEEQAGTLRDMPHPVPKGSYVRWRVAELKAGAEVLQDIAARVEGRSASRSVERALVDVVREEKLDTIVTAVRRAVVEAPARRDLVSGGGSEAGLRKRVESFDAARGHIDSFLTTLENLGAHELRRGLLRLVGWEAEKILDIANDLLSQNQLYAIDQEALQAWEGGQGLARNVFGVRSQAGLVAYLAQQRARLSTLAEDYARPAMDFLYDHAADYHPENLGDFATWRVLLETLQQQKNKTPGNAIQKLENYVLNNMTAVSAANCTAARASGQDMGDSYIAQRLRDIATAARQRCITVKGKEIRSEYRRLAKRFNENLAERAPFVAPERMGAASSVEASVLVNFLDTFDRSMNAGLGDPRFWGEDEAGRRIVDFLDRLDRGVATLQKAIRQEDGPPTLKVQITPEFRVRRSDEIGGNHIIRWSMRVGDQERSLLNANESMVWTPDETVAMRFTWAKNAPSKPAASSDISGHSVNERTARITFDDPWSLMTMLRRHEVPANGQGGHTLRFVLPVTYAGSGESKSELSGGQAKVFVHLRLRAGGEAIRIPAFPTRAPMPPRTPQTALDSQEG